MLLTMKLTALELEEFYSKEFDVFRSLRRLHNQTLNTPADFKKIVGTLMFSLEVGVDLNLLEIEEDKWLETYMRLVDAALYERTTLEIVPVGTVFKIPVKPHPTAWHTHVHACAREEFDKLAAKARRQIMEDAKRPKGVHDTFYDNIFKAPVTETPEVGKCMMGTDGKKYFIVSGPTVQMSDAGDIAIAHPCVDVANLKLGRRGFPLMISDKGEVMPMQLWWIGR